MHRPSLRFLRLALWGLGMTLSRGAWATPLTLALLREKYASLKEFHAGVEQTKTSPYLLRPLKSKVKIDFAADRLTWTAAGEKPLQVYFPSRGSPVLESQGGLPTALPEPTRLKLMHTLEAVRDLVTMDPKLEERFTLKIEGQDLQVMPRAEGAPVFFRSIILSFDTQQELKSMRLVSDEDETQLTFESLVLKK